MIQLDFYFDYIDPASFVMERRIRSVADSLDLTVRPVPWELRLPGEEPIPPEDLRWLEWWHAMADPALELGLKLKLPLRVPATRKAHEMRLLAEAAHANDSGPSPDAVHERIFQAALSEGADIGRVDVLVGLAVELGLDRTETRAGLDVDRFSEDVDRLRQEGAEQEVAGAPTLVIGASRMEGVHDAATIREFVTGSMDMEG